MANSCRPCTKPSPAMTSRQESPSTTKTSQNLLVVKPACFLLIQFRIAAHRTNSSANLQDYLDVVATQGAYLVPRAGTPVFQEAYNQKFATAFEQHLNAVITEQICRRVIYHGAADEWPMGHTPPDIKEKCNAELKALEELDSATSDDSSNNNDDEKDKGGDDIDAIVGPENPEASDLAKKKSPPATTTEDAMSNTANQKEEGPEAAKDSQRRR